MSRLQACRYFYVISSHREELKIYLAAQSRGKYGEDAVSAKYHERSLKSVKGEA
jgi:hypothetical protein